MARESNHLNMHFCKNNRMSIALVLLLVMTALEHRSTSLNNNKSLKTYRTTSCDLKTTILSLALHGTK
uniref:Uncharacterized protein n=1 Tax=Arundo donax TaxID=35708 RepID=A0A0A9GQU7_ARUDO